MTTVTITREGLKTSIKNNSIAVKNKEVSYGKKSAVHKKLIEVLGKADFRK